MCSYHREFEAYILSSRHLCFRALFMDRKSAFTLQRLFPATSFTKGGEPVQSRAQLSPRPAAQETHPTTTATRISGPSVRMPPHLAPSCLSGVTRRLFRAQPEGELRAASIAAEEAAFAARTPPLPTLRTNAGVLEGKGEQATGRGGGHRPPPLAGGPRASAGAERSPADRTPS